MRINVATALCLFSGLLLFPRAVQAQDLYFPPVSATASWDTVSPASLNWCTNNIAPLYDFLEQENTKGFIVLKDGKIALEKYFGTFTADSLWYWASAGKSLTAFLVGMAQEEGFLSINDPSSDYLGTGWSACTPSEESKITVRHHLTMTTGLDDGVPDNHCTLDSCLVYKAPPGNRWAYHNAPYTLLEKVLVNATGLPVNTYTQQKLKAATGITGWWLTLDYDNVFFSTARSMARFGLLIQAGGVWNSSILMHDTAYFRQMVSTSQSLNESYGYLWWLNGKSSYMLPTVQYVFPGSYAPHAPADMLAGLGKNGQVVSISPSKGLVVVRMGNPPDASGPEVPSQLCDQVWEKLNAVTCGAGAVPGTESEAGGLKIYPDPARDEFTAELSNHRFDLAVYSLTGTLVMERRAVAEKAGFDCTGLTPGIYFAKATTEHHAIYIRKLVIGMRK
jgi:CubicO group peptidase (beta-lactamase class C family)